MSVDNAPRTNHASRTNHISTTTLYDDAKTAPVAVKRGIRTANIHQKPSDSLALATGLNDRAHEPLRNIKQLKDQLSDPNTQPSEWLSIIHKIGKQAVIYCKIRRGTPGLGNVILSLKNDLNVRLEKRAGTHPTEDYNNARVAIRTLLHPANVGDGSAISKAGESPKEVSEKRINSAIENFGKAKNEADRKAALQTIHDELGSLWSYAQSPNHPMSSNDYKNYVVGVRDQLRDKLTVLVEHETAKLADHLVGRHLYDIRNIATDKFRAVRDHKQSSTLTPPRYALGDKKHPPKSLIDV